MSVRNDVRDTNFYFFERKMERATDFEFVRQLPRRTVPEVDYRDTVFDRQVLLNESWGSYCVRSAKAPSALSEEHTKWVTETWEDYEHRVQRRSAFLAKFAEEQEDIARDAAQAAEQRNEASIRLINQLQQRNHDRILTSATPQCHTLLLDFADLRLKREALERASLETAESEDRMMWIGNEENERRELRLLFQQELQRIAEELDRLTRAKLAEEERRREEQRRRAEEARMEEERRRKEQEDADRRRKEQEEEARRAERRRKDEEKRSKARAEREAKRQGGSTEKATDEEDKNKSDQTNRLSELRTASRESRIFRMHSSFDEFLTKLRHQASSVRSPEDLDQLYRWTVAELGGNILFGTAVYIGLNDDTNGIPILRYKYASSNCSAKLLTAKAVLDVDTAPSIQQCIVGLSSTGILPCSHSDLILIGDGPEIGPLGQFLAVPIIASVPPNAEAKVVAVLAMDTFSSNEKDSKLHSNEEYCYSILPEETATAEILFTDKMERIASDVADILGTAQTRVYELSSAPPTVSLPCPPSTISSVSQLHGWLSGALRSCIVNSNIDVYVSILHRPDGSAMTVVAHNGSTIYDPVRDPNTSCHLIGAQLENPNALSFGVSREPNSWIGVQDVSQDERCILYTGSKDSVKQPEALLIIPLVNQDKQLEGVVGLTLPSGTLTDDICSTIAGFIWGQIRGILLPLLAKNEIRTICEQAIEWLSLTTTCKNIYVALSDARDQLEIVTASEGQKWLQGKTWTSETGISHDFLQAADVSDPDSLFLHHEDVSKVDRLKFWNDALKSPPHGAELMMVAIASNLPSSTRDMPPARGIIYADTIGFEASKFTKGDKEMLCITGGLLGSVLDEVATRRFTTSAPLAIEQIFRTDRIRFLKKVFEKVSADVQAITPNQLLELNRYNSPPPVIPVTVAATLIVLGIKPKSVLQWDDARKRVNQSLLEKIRVFDPTSTKTKKAFSLKARKMTKAFSANDVFIRGSYPASCFFTWTFATILLRKASDAMRKHAKEGKMIAESVDESNSTVAEENDDLGEDEGEDDGGSA